MKIFCGLGNAFYGTVPASGEYRIAIGYRVGYEYLCRLYCYGKLSEPSRFKPSLWCMHATSEAKDIQHFDKLFFSLFYWLVWADFKKIFVKEVAFLFSWFPDSNQVTHVLWWCCFLWCSPETIRCPFQVYKISNWLFEKCYCLTHTLIFQFALHNFDKWCADKEAFFLLALLLRRTTVCLLSTTTLAPAAPRENHFEIITGIQFGFINGDRALLHLDSWTCLKWSSAVSLSVASLSLKLLSPTSPDRRASHSSLKGLFFFFSARFLSEKKFTALCPRPDLMAPLPSRNSRPVDSV